MKIPKMCLKQSFSYSKWSLQSIFSLTVLSNCVFFRLWRRKFDEDTKNVLKTFIFTLQVSFTVDLVPDCPFKLCFWQFKF